MRAVKNPEKSAAADRARLRRRKVNPASPPTTLELHGVRIHFPFKPYECQEAYMKKVLEALLRGENALLESPTGTGKTLCLLCSALAWQREQSRLLQQQSQQVGLSQQPQQQQQQQHKPKVPTIIYASRTHSQLSQVVRELRNTRYRPLHAVLGSREQMCIHPKVKKPTSTSADINHDCNKLGKERKCKFRNNLEGFVAPANEEGGTGNDCQPVMDMEDLLKMGTEHKVCPFYYTRSQVENAELILVPYNYLFDKDAKDSTLQGVDWNNSVVIFDEAHNLESFASESASFDLSSTDLGGCLSDITKAINYVDAAMEVTHNLKRENLAKLKAIFLKLEGHIDSLHNQGAYAGEYMMEIFRQGYITHANHEILIDELRKVNDYLMEVKGSSRGSANIDHFVHCLKRVYSHSLEARCLAKAAFYRVYVSPKPIGNQRSGRTISYWCFAPSLAMEELTAKSIIVTSGTLAPLKGLSMELGLKFPHTLENPHIINEKQIHVRVIGKGASGKALSSSYERRQDGEYYAELGNTLVSLAKLVPDGMLIFFPSYGVMETCVERWGGPSSNRAASGGDKASKFFAQRQRKQPSNKYVFVCTPTIYIDENSPRTPWKRLTSTKSVVIEPRSSADLPDAISEFQRLLALPKSRGCILMGVCRGKISEGIDFANEQSRAVVITGLPFPPTHDPKIKMKREYLDASRARKSIKPSGEAGFKGEASISSSDMLSGHEWYTQQAHRAVNQAIGRVIRNRSDYGAVILLDGRFAQSQNKEGLSMWLRPHIKDDEGFGAAVRGLATFYKDASNQAKQMANEEAEAKSLVLEYEEEDAEDSFTRVAIVRRPPLIQSENAPNEPHSRHIEAPLRDYVAPSDIISRVDVRDGLISKTTNQPSETQELSDFEKTVSGKFDSVFQKPARTESPASQFFQKAKRLLSHDELAIVKKAVVGMRTFSEKKDTRSYSLAAQQIMALINKHEHLESTVGEGETRMLLLFFELQSKSWKEQIQKMAMRMTFDSSLLGRLCAEHLPDSHRRVAQSDMVKVLIQLWCRESSGGLSKQEFFGQSKEVLLLFLRTDRVVSSSLVDAFTKLIPPSSHSDSQALINELKANINVEKMKAADKARQGEASVSSDQFRRPSSLAQIKEEHLDAVSSDDRLAIASAQPALKRALEVPISGAYNNPYAKKKVSPQADAGVHSLGRPMKQQLQHRSASLSSVLRKVEQSAPYIPPTCDRFSSAARTLQKKSNGLLGKDLSCPVCTTVGLKEPFIAECGHISCLDCWKLWLGRSPSCPTCRKPASKETLARVVFENLPDAMTNCIGNANTIDTEAEKHDESSDDELEIT